MSESFSTSGLYPSSPDSIASVGSYPAGAPTPPPAVVTPLRGVKKKPAKKREIPGEIRPILPYKPSTLETIDYALYEWLNEEMDIYCTTNEGFKKVPIIWVSGERSGLRANNIRTRSGMLKFPLITIERKSVVKDLTKKGYFYGNIDPISFPKGGSITIERRIQPEKTRNFLNADSAKRFGANGNVTRNGGQINFPSKKEKKKVVYETLTVPMPVYLDITYSINIKAEYQQQINEIIAPLAVKTGGINHFIARKDGHGYECFIQPDFGQDNNISNIGEDRRTFVTSLDIKTLGYIIGADKNAETPNVAIRENAVDVKIPREHVVLGDELPWVNGKYRR